MRFKRSLYFKISFSRVLNYSFIESQEFKKLFNFLGKEIQRHELILRWGITGVGFFKQYEFFHYLWRWGRIRYVPEMRNLSLKQYSKGLQYELFLRHAFTSFIYRNSLISREVYCLQAPLGLFLTRRNRYKNLIGKNGRIYGL